MAPAVTDLDHINNDDTSNKPVIGIIYPPPEVRSILYYIVTKTSQARDTKYNFTYAGGDLKSLMRLILDQREQESINIFLMFVILKVLKCISLT